MAFDCITVGDVSTGLSVSFLYCDKTRRQRRPLAFTSDTIYKLEIKILFQCCPNTAQKNKSIPPIDFGITDFFCLRNLCVL